MPLRPIESFANSMFEKKMRYSKSSDWILPRVEDLHCNKADNEEVESFQDLKSYLNCIKSKLNDYPTEVWSEHTSRRDPAGTVRYSLKKINAEFVTTAWCKLYECLNQFPIVPSSEFNSLHLCEVPGGFIAALNHYLYSTFSSEQIKWNWISTSLNPYCESNPFNKMIADDRFLLHSLDHWVFGEDMTGDIKNRKNIEKIIAEAKKLGQINLITADGSIDCMENPQLQEENVSSLHFSEICTTLSILSDNGSFVIKMFTLFSMMSISMMYLLNCVFREVNIFKPATSKCGNSEVYVVCLGFDRKIENFNEYLTLMLSQIEEKTTIPTLFKKSQIPLNFLRQHEVYVRMLMHYQINAIENNIYHFENPSPKDVKQCKIIRAEVTEAFLRNYKIKSIPKEYFILRGHEKIHTYKFISDYQGSYTERCNVNDLSPSKRFNSFKSYFNEVRSFLHFQHQTRQILRTSAKEFVNLSYYFGKSVEKLKSSLFCRREFCVLRTKIESIFPGLCKNLPKLLNSCCELYHTDDHKNCSVVLHFEAGFSSADYGSKEKEFFEKIFTHLASNPNLNKIIFRDFAFLTHYSMSFLKVFWMNYFTDISIRYDDGINIIELKTKKNCVPIEKQINSKYLNNSLFCVLDIRELHQNKFSEEVHDFNNAVIVKFFDTIFSKYFL